jgi:hypothetical protein
MLRWLLGLGLAVTASGFATAQNSRDVTAPGYLVIRVILDAGAAPAPSSVPLGGEDPGGSDSGGLAGGFGAGPGGGATGPMGPMGGGGGTGRGTGSTVDLAKSIHIVAPFQQINFKPFYKDKRINRETNPVWPAMKTKYGITYLYADGTSIQFMPVPADVAKGVGFQSSLESPIKERYRKWSSDRKFEPIYELTVDALALGMVDDAFTYANETVKLLEVLKTEKDRKPSEKVAKFAEIWSRIGPKLDTAVPAGTEPEEWRNRLSAGAIKTGKHYSIVYWGERQINPAVLDRRLNALERNFKAFYLWHALQGLSPAIPDRGFTVVLADRVTDMPSLREKLDGLSMQSDAFYSPAHDLLVFSPERTDQLGAAFQDLARASYKNGWSRDELLKGIPPSGGQKQSPGELARMMTLALVDKLVEEEMDHSAMSREATRQLYFATGMLPRNVQLPNWLESGLASFLQHPKGPAFGKDMKGADAMVIGLAYGYGAPNYIQHRHYRELDSAKALNPNPDVLLKNVLMDRYFEAAKAGTDIDPPPPRPQTSATGAGPMGPAGGRSSGQSGPGSGGSSPPMGGFGPMGGSPPMGGFGPMGPAGGTGESTVENVAANLRMSKERLLAKADATSWALVYYLSRGQMDGLKNFYRELGRMPRDMRLDEKVVLKTFCKCFNLMDRQKVDQVDEAAFKHFAEMWVRSMRNVPVYGVELAMVGSESGGGNQGTTGAPPGRGGGGRGGQGP